MRHGKLLRVGGYLSGGVLILFGIAVIALGIWAFSFTRDSIEQEGIVFGPASDPAVAEHAEQWAGEPVETGSQVLAFAEIMREHTLSSTGGLTYAQMGQYQSAADPSDPVGTNDEAEAAKDADGQPISNGARDIWVTETALTTALNVGYMAEMLAIFSIVVGVALLLAGIGFVILALAVFRRSTPGEAVVPPAPATRALAGHCQPSSEAAPDDRPRHAGTTRFPDLQNALRQTHSTPFKDLA